MVELNENFIIFLTLFMLSFSLPKFLLLFGAKLLFMLFMLLIAFQVLLFKIKLHVSAFLGHLQTITTFAPSVLLVSFFFSHMSITNLSLGQGFVVFLAMAKLKRGIGVMIRLKTSYPTLSLGPLLLLCLKILHKTFHLVIQLG